MIAVKISLRRTSVFSIILNNIPIRWIFLSLAATHFDRSDMNDVLLFRMAPVWKPESWRNILLVSWTVIVKATAVIPPVFIRFLRITSRVWFALHIVMVHLSSSSVRSMKSIEQVRKTRKTSSYSSSRAPAWLLSAEEIKSSSSMAILVGNLQ